MAIAIKINSILSTKSKPWKLSHQPALVAITEVILQCTNIDELIPQLIETIQRVMQVDNVAILRLDASGQMLVMDTVRGPEEAVFDQVRVPVGQGEAGRIVASEQPLVIPDLAKADVVSSFLSQNVHSLLGVPLRVADRSLGAIHVSTLRKRTFTRSDVRLLEVIADRIALALERLTMVERAPAAQAPAEEPAGELEAIFSSMTDGVFVNAARTGLLAGTVIQRAPLPQECTTAHALALEDTRNHMQRFLGMTSHELRSPLTVIKGNAQLAERVARKGLDSGDTPESVKIQLSRAVNFLESVNRQADHMNRVIADLLDMTLIQADKLELEVSLQDIDELVRDVVKMQQVDWSGREITLDGLEGPVEVPCDADRIRQVVTKLLTNALQYSLRTYAVRVKVTVESDTVRVAVIDQGPGLTVEQQEHLFDAFVQAEGVRQHAGDNVSGAGLGLGLFICQAVVRQHNGDIGVESKVGSGSTFWFTLPVKSQY